MKKDWMVKESELDDDQLNVLFGTFNKSCIVAGCAGSGKSVLALIKAQRIQKECGDNYKIIVFTKALCKYMNSGRKELGLTNDFYYYEEWKYKRDVSGRYAKDENGNRIPYMPPADYIIVDEIQDFSDSEIREFLNATKKNFFFFGDTAQSIYDNIGRKTTVPVEGISSMLSADTKVKNWELYRNYRLPLPVAKVVQYVGVDLPPFIESTYKSKETSVPRFLKYDDEESQIKAIHDIIAKNNMTDVAVLLPSNERVIDVYNRLKALGGNYELKYNDKENFRNNQDNLNFESSNPKVMTYHSAKGLQFETVFLPFINYFSDTKTNRKSLYVAMTRTYRNLYVLFSDYLPPILSEIRPELYKTTEIDEIEDL